MSWANGVPLQQYLEKLSKNQQSMEVLEQLGGNNQTKVQKVLARKNYARIKLDPTKIPI